jgi:hypothetical protein
MEKKRWAKPLISLAAWHHPSARRDRHHVSRELDGETCWVGETEATCPCGYCLFTGQDALSVCDAEARYQGWLAWRLAVAVAVQVWVLMWSTKYRMHEHES